MSRRGRKDEDLDAEIRAHLDEAIRDRIARGEIPGESFLRRSAMGWGMQAFAQFRSTAREKFIIPANCVQSESG
jgi:hypothetical protein